MSLDPDLKAIAQGKNFAALTTLMPDGQPQTQIMWVGADDDHVLINGREYTVASVSASITLAAVPADGSQTITLTGDQGLANGNTVEIAGTSFTLSDVGVVLNAVTINPAVPAGAGWTTLYRDSSWVVLRSN